MWRINGFRTSLESKRAAAASGARGAIGPSRVRQRACTALLTLTLTFSAAALAAQSALPVLTKVQARDLMAYALRSNQTQAAAQIAQAFLSEDKSDPAAHYTMAMVYARSGNLPEARKSSRLAFRYSKSDVQSFMSADLSARLAYQDKSLTWAQYWLRRAHTEAPDAVQQRRIEQDFKRVRTQNPFQFRIDTSVAPSSNVNNGSLSRYMIIDGVPVIGVNVGDAMALSGIEAMLNARLGYRLRESQTTETRAVARYFMRRVTLSDDARQTAPGARGSDYAYSLLEGGLRHAFRPSRDGPVWSVGALVGRAWYANDPSYDLARLEGGGTWQKPGNRTFSILAKREWRRETSAPGGTDVFTGLTFGYSKKLKSGDALSTLISLNKTDDATPAFSSRGAGAQIRYTFDKPIGTVQLSTALSAGFSDYSDYRVGFIQVPGGRQDLSLSGEVELSFLNMQYAGFAPTLTFRALTTDSNVSRFDTRQFSVNIGIRSAF
ncbi:hypothetical protein [Thiosulfatihalobacter marinus]|uniref:hypothetical protein n=1 Tax=Thiosulfatihalobacter marinus TaxID=2792481 RepID=UPI0018D9AD4A|nr:hypothetical protein [Thiosulfatihalobacter marinus]